MQIPALGIYANPCPEETSWFCNSGTYRFNDRPKPTIIRIIYKNLYETGYGSDSPTCQAFSLTSFSLSSMYLPGGRMRITASSAGISDTHLPCISGCCSMP